MTRFLTIIPWFFSAVLTAAAYDVPRYTRIAVQYIEVPPAELTAMMADGQPSGAQVHAETLALVRTGRASIMETAMVIARSGQRATVESIGEHISPCEYDPGIDLGPRVLTMPLRPPTHTAFETRNVGVTLEVEPTISDDHRIVDLRLIPEIVNWLRDDIWMPYHDEWGDASVRTPVYETWRHNTSVTLRTGRFELLGVITPKPRQAPFLPRKILLFTRADVIAVKP